MPDTGRQQSTDWQELQPPVTKACMFGLIGGTKGKHYECENRACACSCHGRYGYAKSWKRDDHARSCGPAPGSSRTAVPCQATRLPFDGQASCDCKAMPVSHRINDACMALLDAQEGRGTTLRERVARAIAEANDDGVFDREGEGCTSDEEDVDYYLRLADAALLAVRDA